MRRFGPLLFALALIVVAVGLRWPFLHRAIWNVDEGVTFTMAAQVRHGDVLYLDAADHRSPLVPYLKAAVFAACGDWNTTAVHVLLALLLGASAVMLWRLCRRLGDEITGVTAALIFSVLSFGMLDPADALSANTGWFLVFFSTAGFLAFAFSLAKNSLCFGALSGTCFGLAILCKQPGLLDFGVTWVLLALLATERPTTMPRRQRFQLWLALLTGAALPVAAFALYFSAHGALRDAIYYAFTYNTKVYVPEVPQLARLAMMRRPFELAFDFGPAALTLVVAGALALLVHAGRAVRVSPWRLAPLPWLILGWSAAGLLSTGLSGRGFSHYSAQVVPSFSLAAGWIVARLLEQRLRPGRLLRHVVVPLVVLVALLLGYNIVRRYRQIDTREDFGRMAGEMLARQSAPTDRILIWGYSPDYYAYARRLPASRFLYSNFVTGLIPWTNLDPFIDTSYASVPGSHDALARDLARHSPALILDTGTNQGYLKYPIAGEPALRSLIQTAYAQVDVAETQRRGLRLFRRLAAAGVAPLPADAPANPNVVLNGYDVFDRREPARLQLHAPTGTTRVELWSGDTRIATLLTPPNRPVDALFFVDPKFSAAPVRAIAALATAPGASVAFDFATFADRLAAQRPANPLLHLDSLNLRPQVARITGTPLRGSTLPDTWRVDAPSELEYQCPPGVVAVSFVHGQEPAAQGRSDGYDLVVEFRAADGSLTVLQRQRLHPHTNGADQQPQRARILLPSTDGGRLRFRFLAGERNNPDYDWIFFGQLTGETRGPALRLGQKSIFPSVAESGAHAPLRQLSPSRWTTPAPALLEWRRPDSLATLDLTFGLDDGSFNAPTGHSDGIVVSLDLIGDDGPTRRLFTQSLWPFNHPEHRGPQHAHVDLPPHTPGRLVWRVDPGPQNDASWDWAWLDEPLGEGYGPAIVLDHDHRLVADSSRVLDGSPSKRDGPDRWGAHADSELVFTRPANLRQVIFTYGLADGAARDESGHRRSDGVVVTVEFIREGADAPVALFRRALDPFANPADSGPQTTTLDLPRWQPGRLIFRIDRGPNHDAGYDWAFWGPFSGKTESE